MPVFSLFQKTESLKTGILFWGIYFKSIKHKPSISLNVGKQEISFPVSVSKKSKNHSQKLILTFQHSQTRPQRLFFEWIPGLEVSGEKKMGCDCCPHWKTSYDFYASIKKETHKSHKWFSGHYFRVAEITDFFFAFVDGLQKV